MRETTLIESTLAHLGVYLKNAASLNKKQVQFADKEQMFSTLSKASLPIELPGISYSTTGVSDPNTKREERHHILPNVNFTTKMEIHYFPVKIPVSIAFLSNSVKDYFRFVKIYISMIRNPIFKVNVQDEQDAHGYIEAELWSFSELSTPPSGKEGRDFDRGRYYVLEGSFEVSTYESFYKEKPMIRKMGMSIEEAGIVLSDMEFPLEEID